MLIEVTKLDIKRGQRWSTWDCPVARAIRRTIKYKKIVEVRNSIIIENKSFKLNIKVVKFILNFDRYLPVKPITFNLRGL